MFGTARAPISTSTARVSRMVYSVRSIGLKLPLHRICALRQRSLQHRCAKSTPCYARLPKLCQLAALLPTLTDVGFREMDKCTFAISNFEKWTSSIYVSRPDGWCSTISPHGTLNVRISGFWYCLELGGMYCIRKLRQQTGINRKNMILCYKSESFHATLQCTRKRSVSKSFSFFLKKKGGMTEIFLRFGFFKYEGGCTRCAFTCLLDMHQWEFRSTHMKQHLLTLGLLRGLHFTWTHSKSSQTQGTVTFSRQTFFFGFCYTTALSTRHVSEQLELI